MTYGVTNHCNPLSFSPTDQSTTSLTLPAATHSTMKLTILAVLLASISSALAFPGGAPVQACINLTPNHGAMPQPPPSPYTIDLSAFVIPNMTSLYFMPGVTYTSKTVYVYYNNSFALLIRNWYNVGELPASWKTASCN